MVKVARLEWENKWLHTTMQLKTRKQNNNCNNYENDTPPQCEYCQVGNEQQRDNKAIINKRCGLCALHWEMIFINFSISHICICSVLLCYAPNAAICLFMPIKKKGANFKFRKRHSLKRTDRCISIALNIRINTHTRTYDVRRREKVMFLSAFRESTSGLRFDYSTTRLTFKSVQRHLYRDYSPSNIEII